MDKSEKQAPRTGSGFSFLFLYKSQLHIPQSRIQTPTKDIHKSGLYFVNFGSAWLHPCGSICAFFVHFLEENVSLKTSPAVLTLDPETCNFSVLQQRCFDRNMAVSSDMSPISSQGNQAQNWLLHKCKYLRHTCVGRFSIFCGGDGIPWYWQDYSGLGDIWGPRAILKLLRGSGPGCPSSPWLYAYETLL